HKVGHLCIAVNTARPDLPHQMHSHGIAAQCEKSAMPKAENACVTPDEVKRQSQYCIREVLAGERNRVRRCMQWNPGRYHKVHPGEQQYRRRQNRGYDPSGLHASTARPRTGISPRGLRWMNKITITNNTILPSTAPANGSRSLLTMPNVNAPST